MRPGSRTNADWIQVQRKTSRELHEAARTDDFPESSTVVGIKSPGSHALRAISPECAVGRSYADAEDIAVLL